MKKLYMFIFPHRHPSNSKISEYVQYMNDQISSKDEQKFIQDFSRVTDNKKGKESQKF
jgi:hypothetical protein